MRNRSDKKRRKDVNKKKKIGIYVTKNPKENKKNSSKNSEMPKKSSAGERKTLNSSTIQRRDKQPKTRSRE